MSTIPDFTEDEHASVLTALKQHWPDRTFEIRTADAEIRMSPDDQELTVCPTLFWLVDDVSFVIIKTANSRYRCQLYYRGHQQYGADVSDFDDITRCVVTMLQVHAETEMKEDQQ